MNNVKQAYLFWFGGHNKRNMFGRDQEEVMFRDGDRDGVVHGVIDLAGVGNVNLNEWEMIQFLVILPVANSEIELLFDHDEVEVGSIYLDAELFSCPDVEKANRIRRI